MESDDILPSVQLKCAMRSPVQGTGNMHGFKGEYAWQLSRRIKWLAVAKDVREGMWELCETCNRQQQRHLHGACVATTNMTPTCPKSEQSLVEEMFTRRNKIQILALKSQRLPVACKSMPSQRGGDADDLKKLIRDKTALKNRYRLSRESRMRFPRISFSLGTLIEAAHDAALGLMGLKAPGPSEPPRGSPQDPSGPQVKRCFHPVPMTPTTIRLIARSIDRHFFHGRFHSRIARLWHKSDLPHFSAEALLPPWVERKPMDSMRPLRYCIITFQAVSCKFLVYFGTLASVISA